MVNPIASDNFNDAYVLAKYNNGVKDTGYDFGTAATTAGIFGGGYGLIKGGKWAWQNRHDYNAGWQNVKNGFAQAKTLRGTSLKETYLNVYRTNYISDLEKRYRAPKTLSATEQAKLTQAQLVKYNRGQAISAEYNNVRRLIQESKSLRGQDLLNKQREINQAVAEAKLAVAKGKAGGSLAPTTKTGKAVQWVKNKTGITKANIALKSAAANGNKVVRVLTKAPKGTPATAVVGMALEADTIINSYKKLGAGKGTKQLCKSAAIVGAGVLGYAVGSAALGAAVGSVVPIAGTAVGAVVGLVGGILGAWGADTLARKLLPSELEIDAKKKAEEAAANPEKMKKLLQETEVRAKDETDESTLASLQKSYDNLSVQFAAQNAGTEQLGTEEGGAKKGKISDKFSEVLKKIQNQLESGWNFFNTQDLYNSLRSYEKPTYPQLMGTPYGWSA